MTKNSAETLDGSDEVPDNVVIPKPVLEASTGLVPHPLRTSIKDKTPKRAPVRLTLLKLVYLTFNNVAIVQSNQQA